MCRVRRPMRRDAQAYMPETIHFTPPRSGQSMSAFERVCIIETSEMTMPIVRPERRRLTAGLLPRCFSQFALETRSHD